MASNASSPLIGITTYLEPTRFGSWDTPAAVLPRGYLDGVLHAGGTPILLPPVDRWEAAHLANLDGLVVSGGPDIDPARYGAEREPATGPARPDRDAAELALITLAFTLDLPLLGVCRGMQLMNVVLGGTLCQHLPDLTGSTDHRPGPGAFGRVSVTIEPGSRLATALGERIEVDCHHHQAIDRLGDRLTVVARADDGTVEAVEMPGPGFAVGVQWHPEEDGVDRRLFQALVGAVGR